MTTRTIAAVTPITKRGYVRPDVLVSTEWLAEQLGNPKIRVVESDEDVLLYEVGHIPGAVKIDWVNDLNDLVRRDYIDREQIQAVLRAKGIDNDTTIVLYGDKNNWWATYTFWVLGLFGIENVKIMDGGRARWEQEDRPFTTAHHTYPPGNIEVAVRDDTRIRAFRTQVLEHAQRRGQLVDVRSPEEYAGTRLHMPDYPNEGALRGGHIPGAKNVPWARAVDPETHVFKDAADLRKIYLEEQGLLPDQETVAYCRIGERSSHTWFALTYLLGFENVRNYDGSWTEWGNTVAAPIER